jgi:hypothetical protein
MKKYLIIYHSTKKINVLYNFVMGFGPTFYSLDK